MLETIKIEEIIKIAQEAGAATMEIYQKDFAVEYKDDQSPLTEADIKANAIICEALTKLYPTLPILSEENKTVAYSERKDWEYYWCIDPIDGTKEFIKKNDEFTINIALIAKNTPVLGVVYAPALGELYYAKKGEGAYKRVLSVKCEVLSEEKLPLQANDKPNEELAVVASKSHLSDETQAFIDNLALSTQHLTLTSKGSSLKLCMIATGEADIYPRLAPTMEWDTAAADAIVREAGKMSYQFESETPLVYNKEDLLNPWFVVK
ncbi:MAG: 3'(2'),5'-bisphosphate nucleotidase CysQ [Campylobacterales bacterium]|nr:3'(2'),5'-bisphosphate nucleotidase CysQ [Campylobacterales bacterium]